MELLNKRVKHSTYGIGTVVEFSKNRLAVQFEEKVSRFVYPDVFFSNLTAEEPSLQEAILEGQIPSSRAKEAKASVKKAEESAKVGAKEAESEKGERKVFFVYQEKTFPEEFNGGYIRAPVANRLGKKFHHWTRLREISKGDIILHSVKGKVQAISEARGAYYAHMRTEDLWDEHGRKVDCAYTFIENPIKTADFVDEIIALGKGLHQPFNKNGGRNMGYLFALDRELSRVFVAESVKKNPGLAFVPYVAELLG